MSRDPRDWQADMEMCNKATRGPWKEFVDSDGHSIGTKDIHPQLKAHAPVVTLATSAHGKSIYISQNDSDYIIAAREALPYWLQQYKDAVENLTDSYNELNWSYGQQRKELDKAEAKAERLTADKARLTIDMYADANNYQVQAKEMGELRKRAKLVGVQLAQLRTDVDNLVLTEGECCNHIDEILATLYPLEREDTHESISRDK